MKDEKWAVKKGSMDQIIESHTFMLPPSIPPQAAFTMPQAARLAIHPASRQLLPVLGPPIPPHAANLSRHGPANSRHIA